MPSPVEQLAIETIAEVKRRAHLFVIDNFSNPILSDFLVVENAMLIGASIALETQARE